MSYIKKRKNKTNIQILSNQIDKIDVKEPDIENSTKAKPAKRIIEIKENPIMEKEKKKKPKTINTKLLLTRR